MSEMPERIWAYPDTKYSYKHTVFTDREPIHHTTKISHIRADIREAAVAALQAELDTEREKSKGLADLAPAWHDAPTCEGLWVEEWANGVVFVTRITIFQGSPMMVVGAGALEPIRDYHGLRWYGPIPEDRR